MKSAPRGTVFISYPRAVSEVVHRLVTKIEALGFQVTFDRRIYGGQQWWDEILDFIKQADIFIWVLAPQTLKSEACRAERLWAQQLNRSLLYIKVAPVDNHLLPPNILSSNYVDYSTPSDDAYQSLIEALLNIPAAEPLPDPIPEPPPMPVYSLHAFEQRLQDTTASLSADEQEQIFIELKSLLSNPDLNESVTALLRLLLARRDVLRWIAEAIEGLFALNLHQPPDPLSRRIGLTNIHDNCDADWFCDMFNRLQPGQELLWLDTYCPHWNELRSPISSAVLKGAHVRMLAIDPNCENAEGRAKELEASGWGDYAKFQNECSAFISTMSGLETELARMSDVRGTFAMRLYRDLPSIPFYVVLEGGQPRIGYNSFFLSQATGFDFFHFEWSAPDAFILHHFVKYFDDKWNRQKPRGTP